MWAAYIALAHLPIMSPKEGTTHHAHEVTDDTVTRLAELDEKPWYKKHHLRLLYLTMFPACIGVEMTSGFDSSMINGLQSVNSWDAFFHSPRSTLLGLISAMYSLGAILVLPFVPLVTDRLGRRHAITLGSVLMIIGAALQTASQNYLARYLKKTLVGMFVASRLIIGLGIPFAIVAASSLIGELSHPKERAIIGSLFNSCYFIGSIVAAGVTLGTFKMQNNWGWRIPSLLQLVPSALQIMFIYFMPESPRWLISKGRGDEAMAILVKYHAEGDENSEFVKAEYVQIEKTLELEREADNLGWGQLVATPGMPFLVELFPFQARAKGISVFQFFSRGAGFFNQFVNPIGIANAGWKYYISYCIFLLFEVIFVYFLFPETHGHTLEELAFLYEDDKVVEQKKRVEKEIHEHEGDLKIDEGKV
ncbi:hypothetical protein H0H93_007583 [Arthromyces matolae]|nr:hypothetical protein H0H93_007583 [Arthromyces matolae]